MSTRRLVAGWLMAMACAKSSPPTAPGVDARADQGAAPAVDASAVDAGAVDASADQAPDAPPAARRLLYGVFDDGSIHVYDIDDAHREVASFATTADVVDARGACVSPSAGVFYFAHQRPEAGHVVAVDLRQRQVLWSRAFLPNVDRLSCSRDGKKLYVPSNEAFVDDALIVVDAARGDELTRIHVSPRPHDCLDGPLGTHVYIETKSSPLVGVIDTATDTVVRNVGPFADIVGPFTLDSRETRLYANVFGVNGFQIADVATGKVLATASIDGQTAVAGGLNQHGIALNPRETEVWVNDGVGGQPVVHVFDVTVNPPVPRRDVQLDFASHWVTFTIDGDYAYVAGPKGAGLGTNVIDTTTYTRVGSIGPSEDLVEVQYQGDRIVRVGNQYGVGRAATAP